MDMYIQIGKVGHIPVGTRRREFPKPEDEGRHVRVHTVSRVWSVKVNMNEMVTVFYGRFVDANGEEIDETEAKKAGTTGWVRVYEHEVDMNDGVVMFTRDLL